MGTTDNDHTQRPNLIVATFPTQRIWARECWGSLSTHEIRVILRSFVACANPPEMTRLSPSRKHQSGALHKQSFDPLEPKADLARTLVEFDPRRVPFA